MALAANHRWAAEDKRKRKIIRSCLRAEKNMEMKFRVMPKITGSLETVLKTREARRDELKFKKTQMITENVQIMKLLLSSKI